MAVLYPNCCHNKVCYKGTALYQVNISRERITMKLIRLDRCVGLPEPLLFAFNKSSFSHYQPPRL